MGKLRTIVFWCHLVTGVLAGIVVMIMSATGVLLTYERQMVAWAESSPMTAAVPGAERLPVETLVANARASRSEVPTTVTVRADRDLPVTVAFRNGPPATVDPTSGAVNSGRSSSMRSFFRVVTDLHRWLAASGNSRNFGRAITGACNLAFLFLVVSGIFIWWPRKWTAAQLRNVLWFRRGLSAKARDFNWHNTIGFWCLLPLFVVVLSGVVISYGWAGNLVYRVVGEQPPAPRGGPPPPREEAAEVSTEGLEPLVSRAKQQMPDWKTISFQLPADASSPVTFTIDAGTGGQPQHRALLTLDRATGEVVKWEPFSSYSAGRQLRSILRFAHTGEVLGLTGQTVAGIVSLGGAFLVWTGLALSWRRFRAWVARRRRVTASAIGAGISEESTGA